MLLLLFMFVLELNAFDKLDTVNTLYVGDSLRIDGSEIKKVAVSNSRVIKALNEVKGELVINAKTKGSSTLHIWYKGKSEPARYSFTVLSSAVYRKLAELRTALNSIKGIKIYSAGEKVYITGVVQNPEEMELISRVANSSKDVVNYARLSSNHIYGEYTRLVDGLFELGLHDVNLRRVDQLLFLDAVARTKKQIEDANFYVKQNYPLCRFDVKLIPYQIDIDVKIVEINESQSRNMGLDVQSEFNLSRHTVISRLEVESILNLSEGKGYLRLLSNPSLSSNDGELAVFHVGGSIPIKLSSRYSASLDWKNYGVILNFTPKVINEDTVELSIATEFSSINNENSSTSDVPAFLVREVKTIVTLEAGKSVVISGLVSRNISKANRGLPVVASIPVVSDFFSSNTDSSDSTELAVVVTPMIRFRVGDAYIDRKLDSMLAEVLSEDS